MKVSRAAFRTAILLAGVCCSVQLIQAIPIYNNGSPNQSDGSNITGFVAADDFTLGGMFTLTGGTFWSSANFDPFTDSFSGIIGWAILANKSGAPGAILFSGSDSSPVLTDTGVKIFGTDEWKIDFSFGALNLGPGTYWLALHEGALGTTDDGTTIFWDTTGSLTGSVGQITADLTASGGWTTNGLNGGSNSDLAFQLSGTNGGPSVPEPSYFVPLFAAIAALLTAAEASSLRHSRPAWRFDNMTTRKSTFSILLLSLGPFAPCSQAQLTHSRLNPLVANIFNCCNTDTLSINIVLSNDQTLTQVLGPASYIVYVNGVASGTALLDASGNFANPDDPMKPWQQTIVVSGLAGMDGQYQPFSGTFAYAIQVNATAVGTVTTTNAFIYDYLYSFLGIPVTVYWHQPRTFVEKVPVTINSLKPQNHDHQCPRTSCGGGGPMTGYSFNSMLGGISLSDMPISYNPPHGEPIRFGVTYNQRDTNQPTTFTQSNLGPKWTFNWLSYISEGPATGQTQAVRYLPGGGQERYLTWTTSSSLVQNSNGQVLTSLPHPTTQAVLQTLTTYGLIRPNYYQLTLADGTIETYDNNAGGGTNLYLTKRVDPQGNTITINYAPSSAQILAITDALGQQTTFTYGLPSDGLKITQVTDPFGRSASFTYDAEGRLTSITDPVGIVSGFGYQGSTDVVSSLTTPYGTTTFNSQEGAGYRILQATDPLGQTERLEYRASLASFPTQEAAVPSAPGLVINNQNLNLYNSFYWDKQAYATAIAAGATPGSAAFYTYARVTHWALEPWGVSGTASSMKAPLESRVWSNFQGQANADFIDPTATALPSLTARLLDDGSTQLYQRTYNANGLVIQSIDPVGRETDYVYAANGQDLIQTTQKNGASNEQLFAATYNSIHLPLTATDAASQTTTTTYNAFGQPLTITNAKSELTTLVYDANGYLQTTTGAILGSTTTFTYDAAGRVQTLKDSEGYIVTNGYDNLNRLTKQTFPDGTFRQTVYDRLSVGSTTDRLSRTTTYTNDPLGRVIQIKDPLNRIINQTWCKCGSLQTLQDANGNITTWKYDIQGRLVSKTYADGKGDVFAYETSTSRLKSKTDALGQVISYGYGGDNNLLSITYTNAKNPTPNVSFTYDPAYNRRVSMTDGTGLTTYGYYLVNGVLGSGRLQSVAGPLANSTITYTYDQLGRIVGRSINGAANQMSMVYDALGRVTSESNGLGTFSTGYVNQTARPSSLTYPNGQSTVYSYFNNLGDQRLQEIKNLSGASVLSQFDYTYDAEGEIVTWGQQTSAVNLYSLVYDLAGQLTSANLTGATAKTFAYAYDPAANRSNETINSAANPVTANNLNELVSRTGSNARSFAYDADGNLISNNGTARSSTNYTYQWDAEKRLISINYPTTNQQTLFTYDGLGRRVKIVEKTGATITSTKQFIWDGLTLAEERDASGNLTKMFYSQGQVNGAALLFYTRDHLGSVREVVNGGGVLQARYDYDPYGRRTLTTGSDVSDFGFTGHYYHAASKLHLAPYRSYDADYARWLTRDLLQESSGTNLFGYVQNRSLNSVDPLGLNIVVLNNPNVLGGIGHNAILVGNDAIGWSYYSNEPPSQGFQRKQFTSYDDFLKTAGRYYQNRLFIPTTKEQDDAARALGEQDYGYGLLGLYSNCADFVGDDLQTAGLYGPTPRPFPYAYTSPSHQFKALTDRYAPSRGTAKYGPIPLPFY